MTSAKRFPVGECGSPNKKETYIAKVQRAVDGRLMTLINRKPSWTEFVFTDHTIRYLSMRKFYGFKLHLVVNERGELLAFRITPGNVDDRAPVPELTQGLTGKLVGDRGYISQQLFKVLWDRGLQLITKIRKNMSNKLMPLADKLLLRKRAIIETINDQIKNIQQVEHTRHRSLVNAMVNILAALVTAYTHQPRKPSLNLSKNQINLLTFKINIQN